MRYLVSLLGLILCVGVQAQSVTIENTAGHNTSSFTGSITVSGFSAGGNANAIVVVWSGRASGTADVATYAGTTMTPGSHFASPNRADTNTRYWYWAPGVGGLPDSGDVVVNQTGGQFFFGVVCVWALSNVDETTPVAGETQLADSGPVNSIINITGYDADSLLISSYADLNDVAGLTNGANQVSPTGCTRPAMGSGAGWASHKSGADTPPGEMSYTNLAGSSWDVHQGFAVLAGAGGPGPTVVPQAYTHYRNMMR